MNKEALPGRIVGPHLLGQKGLAAGADCGLGVKFQPKGRRADRIKVEPKIEAVMKGRWVDGVRARYLDDGYYLPTCDEVRLILANSRVSRMDYVDELFDCDDFAFGVRGEFSLYAYDHAEMRLPFALGIIMGGFKGIGSNHAMCCFVDDTFRVWLVEPRGPNEKAGTQNALDPAEVKFADPSICYDCYLLLV